MQTIVNQLQEIDEDPLYCINEIRLCQSYSITAILNHSEILWEAILLFPASIDFW